MHVAFSALLAEGRPFLGTFIQSAAPEFVEAAGYAGFRFLTVDLEHTYYGPEKTVEMVRAGEAADLCVLACAGRLWGRCGNPEPFDFQSNITIERKLRT